LAQRRWNTLWLLVVRLVDGTEAAVLVGFVPELVYL
jgi:hypothetical protein